MNLLHKSLEEITEGHVFYRFHDDELYTNNLISFIRTGIARNQQILIIENMRNLRKIKAKIDILFSDEQKASIRLMNNFEYYLSSGDFNTQAILKHFQKDLSLLKKLNSSIRTWAHVEWASSEPDVKLLKEFESQADDFVLKERMVSVCAYSSAHLSLVLNTALEQVHKYIMTDDDFYLSLLCSK